MFDICMQVLFGLSKEESKEFEAKEWFRLDSGHKKLYVGEILTPNAAHLLIYANEGAEKGFMWDFIRDAVFQRSHQEKTPLYLWIYHGNGRWIKRASEDFAFLRKGLCFSISSSKKEAMLSFSKEDAKRDLFEKEMFHTERVKSLGALQKWLNQGEEGGLKADIFYEDLSLPKEIRGQWPGYGLFRTSSS